MIFHNVMAASAVTGMLLFNPLAVQAHTASAPNGYSVEIQADVQLAAHDYTSGRPRLYVEPAQARIGARVQLSARGLRPGTRITVMGGRNPGHLRPMGTLRVNERGRIYSRVRMPEWAIPGRNFFFALQSSHGRIIAQSRPIRVSGGGMEDNERLSITGELLRANATCPRLAGDNGRVYTLAGDLDDFEPGDRVRVSGEVAEVSNCQQGTTIVVDRIRDAE